MGWFVLLTVQVAWYVFVVVVYVLAGVPAALLAGGVFLGQYVRAYLRASARAMGVRGTGETAPVARPPAAATAEGAQPAYRQYLFGPAGTDLRQAARLAWPDLRAQGRRSALWIKRRFLREDMSNYRRAAGFVVGIGLVVGTVAAAVVLAAVALVQVAIWGALLAGGVAVVYLLRGVDTVLLWVRGIRVTCPSCHHRVVYPAYECPSCLVRHRDVRPGPYGVARRVCGCGRALPTLLLLGSHRLAAFCPYCGAALASGAGTTRELVVPVLGAQSAGKSRLMLAFATLLMDGDGWRGLTATPADSYTEREYEQRAPALRRNEPTRPTVKDALRGYSFHVRAAGGEKCLLHVFDPAGERLNDSEQLRELRYLRTAGTYIFVVDPLSIDHVWGSLSPGEQREFGYLRARASPEFIFGQVLQNVEAMGVRTRDKALAVAVTKYDLVGHLPVCATLGDSSVSVRRWLAEQAGLDNMLRTIAMAFPTVHFQRVSAMLVDGAVDPGVGELIGWALSRGGLPAVVASSVHDGR